MKAFSCRNNLGDKNMFYAKQEILFDTLIVLFSLQVCSRVWNNPTKTRTAEGIKVVVASPIKVIQVSN